jgi:hypothetical protein
MGRERPGSSPTICRDPQPDRLSRLRYGQHLDLIITDQHSFCGDDASNDEGIGKIYDPRSRELLRTGDDRAR